MTFIRVLEALHGHAGILAAASLFHPVVLMRRGQQLSRGARWAIGLATLFATGAFTMGLVIYEDYRSVVKGELFRISPRMGFFFETKEHLAFAVVSLAIGAGICAFAAPPEARRLRQAAAAMYLSAAVLATMVCALGTTVAAVHGFPE